MKTIIFALGLITLISTSKMEAKSLKDNKIQLTNPAGEKVSMNEIIEAENNTIVIIFDSNNRSHIDKIEDILDFEYKSYDLKEKKIIAICSDKHHNYQQLNAIVAGKDWNIDIYVDTNNSYKRSKGFLDRIFYAYNMDIQTSDKTSENMEPIVEAL